MKNGIIWHEDIEDSEDISDTKDKKVQPVQDEDQHWLIKKAKRFFGMED